MKTRTLNLFVFIALSVVLASCAKDPETDKGPLKNPVKVLIANEGQFTYGTASLTAIMEGDSVRNDVFSTANSRPLGDVAQSITQVDGKIYVALNNSRKVEVMDDKTFMSIETIEVPAATIPTYMCHLGGDSMALTDKGSKGQLIILDLNHGKMRSPVRRVIEGVGSSNQMKFIGNKLFLAGSKLRVFTLGSIEKDKMRNILGSDGKNISVAGDSKIVVDKNKNIWVLNSKKLVCINPATEAIVKELPFTGLSVGAWDGRLDISPSGDKLYFTCSVGGKKGIVAVGIDAGNVPSELTFPLEGVRQLYNMSISPSGEMYVCDVEFGSIARGLVHKYTLSGTKVKTYEAGIFPQYIHFMN